MMSSIIYGGTDRERERLATVLLKPYEIPDIDIFRLTEASVGIGEIRLVKRSLMRKPFQGRYSALLITHANAMTVEAQNALLKILEEPPDHALLILLTPILDNLLPTIQSRCKFILCKEIPETKDYADRAKDIEQLSLGQRLEYAVEIAKDRESAAGFVESMLKKLRMRLHEGLLWSNEKPEKKPLLVKTAAQIRELLYLLTVLKTNANTRVAVEAIFLSW